MTNIIRKFPTVLALLGTVVLISACGGGGGSTPMGTLGVSLTDSPGCGFSAVNVTVSGVRIHQSSTAATADAGWSTITLNPARKINLLDLGNGVLTSLGQTALPAGHYTQLRLVLSANTGASKANSVVLTGTTTEIPLSTPSGVQSGIKLIHQFEVTADQETDVALDFDACKSVVARGNGKYALMPVIKVIPFVLNGIDGYVNTSLLNPENTNDVMVYAEQDGQIIQSAAPDPTTGKFFLARLDTGNYDVVFTANGYETAVIASVPVASATSIVDVSDSAHPIMLSSSTTGTISGTVTLDPPNADVVAYVAAQQTLNGGPTVTVQSQATDLTSGSYTLTLPLAAPLLGTYSSTFPIGFAADPTAAGIYTAQASADGYTAQSFSGEDISGSNVTQNFYLTP